MMKRTSTFKHVTWLILGLLFVASAQAQPLGTVDIYHVGMGANTTIDIYGGGLSGQDVYAGVYMLQKTSGTGAGQIWPNNQLAGFCIEAEEPSLPTTNSYDVILPEDNYSPVLNEYMGSDKADALSELWGRYYDSSWSGSGGHDMTENCDAQAFASAVWEIVYEDMPSNSVLWDVSTDGTPGIGGFASTQAYASQANSWLHSLDGTGPKATLAVFSNNGAQNFLVQVPEPTTVALLGLGGVMEVMRRRRKRMA